jgi:hypothetical protein
MADRVQVKRGLKRDYVTPGHQSAYSGVNKLAETSGRDTRTVREALAQVYPYTIHREYHRPKYWNPVMVYKRRDQLQVRTFITNLIAKYRKLARGEALPREPPHGPVAGQGHVVDGGHAPEDGGQDVPADLGAGVDGNARDGVDHDAGAPEGEPGDDLVLGEGAVGVEEVHAMAGEHDPTAAVLVHGSIVVIPRGVAGLDETGVESVQELMAPAVELVWNDVNASQPLVCCCHDDDRTARMASTY